MPQSKFEKFLPASGVLAGILFALAGFVQSVPGTDATGREALTTLSDHTAQNGISFIASGLFVVMMAFFAVGIRQALRSGETGESTYSSAAFAGGILVAGAIGLSGWITLGMMDAAENKDAATAVVLAVLGGGTWLPWAAGSCVLMLSTGLGGLRNAVLPRWLAITSIVLGVLSVMGPGGILVFFVTPLWLIAVSVVLVRRTTSAGVEAPVPGRVLA